MGRSDACRVERCASGFLGLVIKQGGARRTEDSREPRWVDIAPAVLADAASRRALRRCVRRLISVGNNGTIAASVARIRLDEAARAAVLGGATAPEMVLCVNVLCDLRTQGWQLRVDRTGIAALPPPLYSGGENKISLRAAHLIERDAQLSQPAVRRFIRDMEQRRPYRGKWHSVFSLMRNGRELAAQLRVAAEVTDRDERNQMLSLTINPYVQVVTTGTTCEHTGLALSDIWRYFRHTWSTTYQSTPGRKIFFLVRDRAATNHPVIGIGALGSSIVRIHVRDEWIGWTGAQFLESLRHSPDLGWARWLQGCLRSLLEQIYVADFLHEGNLSRAELRHPSAEAIKRLRAIAVSERRVHRLYPARNDHKRMSGSRAAPSWQRETETHLFRSKRAATLAELLEARRCLLSVGFTRPNRAKLRLALENSGGVRAIQTVLRHVKAMHIGVDMMDITVCGAVAPYNHILGGKLVSLLMASPDVIEAYHRKYRHASSVIASSMAARDVKRRPHLVLLGTTSLYGVGASQYNRLRVPAERIGGSTEHELAFVPLGQTVGYGSYHFSRETMDAIERVLRRLQRGRPVNSIFGEGVNPKLRKVRSALDAVELPSDLLLQHGTPRLVYAVPLARNFRDLLLGRTHRPQYLFPCARSTTERIAEFWRERWLSRRIETPGVMDRVDSEAISYPIHHGARVALPEVADEVGPLFASIEKAVELSP